MNVDLPQPDGPISAVISLRCRSSVTSRIALLLAVEDVDVVDVEDDRRAAPSPPPAPCAASSGCGVDRRGLARGVSLLVGHVLGHSVVTTSARSGCGGRSRRSSSAAGSPSSRGSSPPRGRRTPGPGSCVQVKIWIGSAVNDENEPVGVEARVHRGADHQQRRGLADRAREREDDAGRDAGDRARAAPASRSSATASRRAPASPRGSRAARRGSPRATTMITTGSTSSASVMPPASTTRPSVERAAHDEGEPEDAVDDRRDGGEVLDVDLDRRGSTSARGRRTPRGRSRVAMPSGTTITAQTTIR